MSADGPPEPWIRLQNLRINNEENDEPSDVGNVEGENANAEVFNDSPQNMQPAGYIMISRARRALTFADEEQVSLAIRRDEQSTSSCDKYVLIIKFGKLFLELF